MFRDGIPSVQRSQCFHPMINKLVEDSLRNTRDQPFPSTHLKKELKNLKQSNSKAIIKLSKVFYTHVLKQLNFIAVPIKRTKKEIRALSVSYRNLYN